ncbi:probable THS1 - threonyl tRNA synthetase, cytosolic [Melanopsichium pennsylvanicum]|uniref:Threonine--tRNA ligase, cytoplasmic n=2 Tax=Melanopsichium pennsylvanicum TaxID=63383 RepID=A0AAJ4XS74_9BASI|nr:probable THS1-threonyl tRNA synthetase, cytosolic [Melanopsichium pennsylvanicum 4]SNX87565.1 probable THS1 - threonyl tRNA synthetase, cytosolic [Melanopsichium pennsylvanicum]
MSSSAPQPVSSSAEPRDPVSNLTQAAQNVDLNAQPAQQQHQKKEKPQKQQQQQQQQQQQGQSKGEKKPKAKKDAADGAPKAPLEFTPKPAYFDHRIAMFEKLKAEQDAEFAAKPRQPITVTMPDGSTRQVTSYDTSPMDIAKDISKSLSERIVISKVDDNLWDLERPLEADCKLELFDFESPEGKRVFWHSSAHVLGEACEKHYGCHLCIGPPTEDGFFYEMAMGDSGDRMITQADFGSLETLLKNATKEKQKFERLVVSKQQLLEMFHYNKYKKHIIQSKIPDGTSTTVYRCGPMIDLCVGPHIPHTGRIKAMTVLKNSASYFLGDQNNDSLQRLYGISFPDTKQMSEYKQFLLEAAKRDHRKIGKEQELFMFHELSPGSCFWLPHGARIYNTLQEFLKSEYRQRGFDEVVTPNMFNSKLWQTSGHWQNYKDDMFVLGVDKEQFALKPMNCPGHCLMFASRDRSYKELPLRLADFGVIHRNEASGALSGLTRVRRFCQDDAHIFCMSSQIEEEMAGCFDFLQRVYGLFGFTFKLELSTRPEKFLGDIETWNAAEARLGAALDKFVPGKWELNPGDGAFYGPKIDITISDAMRRHHQCATIQLDFQLPQQFKLEYRTAVSQGGESQSERPVMIHRAIVGSLERFIAILTEHFAGKWPFWLSPRQVLVVPVTNTVFKYAKEVQQKLWDEGFFADVDLSDNTLPKKVRNGEIAQYNFVFVVGHEEMQTNSVNIRNRDDVNMKGKAETMDLEKTIQLLKQLKTQRRLENKLMV